MSGPSADKLRDRGFLLGIIWAAWELNLRGEDTYAADLVIGTGCVERVRNLAHRHGYKFRRGFWSETLRSASE